MKIILLNGPPSSGKDYAGELLRQDLELAVVRKFATEVKERTHAALGLLDEAGYPLPADFFEKVKDQALVDFHGVTPRAAYIQFSEGFAKPLYGEKVFGQWLLERMQFIKDRATIVITDSGFVPEAEVLVERYGAENCLLARIHRIGYDFAGDSRSYIDLSHLNVQCQDINNDGGSGFRTSLATALRLASPA
tara:strand:+ start:12719 stop:13294 length:576 start_codon:yes stop_codon:yes gene_type:complete